MFDIICIDWGSKRTGLAFGSSVSQLILPYSKELFTADILNVLDNEIRTRHPKMIVVGLPTTFHGKSTLVAEQIKEFIIKLSALFPDIKIKTINERNSSKSGKSILITKEKHPINHQAACEILKWYFETVNPTRL